MLDDMNVISQRDTEGALEVAAELPKQSSYVAPIADGDHDGREISNVIVAGMGGSALAADMLRVILAGQLKVPYEVVKGYDLPEYASENSLVIASSHSGNTEETVSCLGQAIVRGCQIAVMATGGQLAEIAGQHSITFAQIPHDTQPRMAVIYGLRVLLQLLEHFGLIDGSLSAEIAGAEDWLASESRLWNRDNPTNTNYAKQLALIAVGKTGMFYGGTLMAPLAYKWKISWNENAKNTAFWNYLPEFNHNEFIGWTSHPVEKPFAVFDLVSELEHPQVLKRLSLSDRLLSGLRPKSNVISIQGGSIITQYLWGSVLADFVSIYLAILNGVDPTKVDLIERFKAELNQ